MSHEQIQNIKKELAEYAQAEGTEIGEACDLLITISNFSNYLSVEFSNAVIKEMELHLGNFKSCYKIVESEIIQTIKCRSLEEK